MVKTSKSMKVSSSMPAAIGMGLFASLAVTLIGAGVLAWLMATERVGDGSMGIGCGVILAVASAAGALLASSMAGTQRLVVSAITAACYYALLLGMTALLFGGEYKGMGTTALWILGGGILSICPAFLPKKGSRRPMKRTRFR